MTYNPQWEECSYAEWIQRLAWSCTSMSPRLIDAARGYLVRRQPLIDLVVETAEVQALRVRRQFGSQYQRMEAGTKPYPQTRFTHVQQVAAHACIAGLLVDLDDVETTTLVVAALLHDLAHPLFSHVGDEWLCEQGVPDHEARACAMILREGPLRQRILACGVEPEAVCEVIQERGRLGHLLSLADTLAYVQLDRRVLNRAWPRDLRLAQDVFAALRSVSVEGIEMRTTQPIQRIIDLRHELMETVYVSVSCRVSKAVVHTLLTRLWEAGQLSVQDMCWLPCAEVEQRLYAWCRAHGSVDLIDLMRWGMRPESPRRQWRCTVVPNETEAHALAAEAARYFVSPPTDHWKSYACLVDGVAHTVTPRLPTSQTTRSWVVVTYVGA